MTKRGCIVLLPCFLQACVLGIDYSPQGRHEAFKSVYGAEVGKNSEDPKTSLLARYPQLVVARRPLTSNSTEVEFRASRDHSCRVFYDVSSQTHIVLSWRFEGSEKDCTWIGP
jgi:hypothetical protein